MTTSVRAAPTTNANNGTKVMATSPAAAASFAVYVGTPQWQSFLFSSVAPTIAAPFTNPFAVAKTQLQVQKGESKRFRGMVDFFRHAVASNNGVKTLQRGLIPVMTREASKNLFRIGLYQPILDQIHHSEAGPAPVWKRMVAGGASGAVGAVVCNPFEIIRIKVQAMELGSVGAGMSSRILKEEGVAGFYRATGASVALGMVCTAVNLTTYTKFREAALEHVAEGPTVDLVCALASGFCAALAMNPIDVVRTRLMTQPSSPPLYRNGFHAAAQIMMTEGPKAFFKGFVPSFLRIGPHFVITFMLLEQMRRVAHTYREGQARDEFLRRVFREMDVDGSGEIDQQELIAALKAADPSGDQYESTTLAKRIFEIADDDKSGSIDQDEFLAAGRKSELDKLLRGQQILVMFRSFDANDDGEIDEMELFQALKLSRPASDNTFQQVSDEDLHRDVRRIIQEIDTDGNGTIDLSEFIVAFDRVNELVEHRLVKEMFRNSGVAVGE